MPIDLDSVDAIKALIGQPPAVSQPVTVDQEMIDSFARTTRDWQWIHVDPARAAAESPYGGTIAHGLLTLALIPAWYLDCFTFSNRKMALNYGFEKVRFLGPVPSGSRLVGSFALPRVDDIKPGEVRLFWQIDVHIEGVEKPVMVATWLTQLRY